MGDNKSVTEPNWGRLWGQINLKLMQDRLVCVRVPFKASACKGEPAVKVRLLGKDIGRGLFHISSGVE